MKFIHDYLIQKVKDGQTVPGDYHACERTSSGTFYLICDGIGSGIYANISAITCASRLMELWRKGMPIRLSSETVAASMHRARTEDIPFSAFIAALILSDGQFLIYAYEAPTPILIHENFSRVLTPRFYTAGFEVISEITGHLMLGDSLVLFSDGVSQAGLGHGYEFGIGSAGVATFINQNISKISPLELPSKILGKCAEASQGHCHDDTTLAVLHCDEAKEITLLTGPPSKHSLDQNYAKEFIEKPGKKIVCGSTTAEIIARELKLNVNMSTVGELLGAPPEYTIDGIDTVTEGAVTLNQIYNILDEPAENLTDNSAVERVCLMLREADVVNLMVGKAKNIAHEDLIFKQIGVRVRKTAVQLLAEKLKRFGKLVTEKYY
ncbi:MAG: SpoIIE family protein phosphatase [Deltaproteobacteria bacterium]|jgi:hypothetical protein|nr:SpoIIE family protein phosphatase [Deltaproteobacteria bacterium]